MAEVIRMPRLSDTMEEGNIISWLKKVGDKVDVGDILAEVETDKATMDLESFNEGVLLYIGKESGTVPVDEVIAIIGEKGEDVDALLKEAAVSAPVTTNGVAKSEEVETVAAAPATAPQNVPQPVPASSSSDQRIKASPLAKKMAADLSIPLASLKGSGEGGRIIKNDVLEAKSIGGASTVPVTAPVSSSYDDVQ